MPATTIALAAVLAIGLAQRPAGDLRVMTYNIKHGQTNAACTQPPATPGQPPSPDCNLDLQVAIAVIREHHPDIAGLQEIDPADVHADRPHQYGTLILSRFPIRSCSTTPLPRTAENEQRGLTLAVIDVNGVPLRFYNTHLHTTAADRLLQTPIIAMATDAAEPGPKILVGDFNARPDAIELQPLMARFTDAWRRETAPPADNPDGLTSPAALARTPRNRIDYVLVSAPAQVRAASVPIDARTRLAADHFPVIVDLTIQH